MSLGAEFLISIGNSRSFRRTRAKSIIKQVTSRGGEKRSGTRAKRVDENSGFANLQFFHKNLISNINPPSHNHFFHAKRRPRTLQF